MPRILLALEGRVQQMSGADPFTGQVPDRDGSMKGIRGLRDVGRDRTDASGWRPPSKADLAAKLRGAFGSG